MPTAKKKPPAAKSPVKESAKAKPTKAKPATAKPKEAPKQQRVRPKSTSGKYKSIRHLLELLFAKDKDITKEEAKVIVKKEFPTASYLRTNKTHFSWYKSHIVGHGTFLTIDPPAWVKGGPKIKKTVRSKATGVNTQPQKEEHGNGKEREKGEKVVQERNEGAEGRVQGEKGSGKGRVHGAQDRAEGRARRSKSGAEGRVRQRRQEEQEGQEGQEEGQEE